MAGGDLFRNLWGPEMKPYTVWPSKVTWGSKSLPSCCPAFSSFFWRHVQSPVGCLDQTKQGKPRMPFLLSSRVYWVVEMPAQVEMIIERAMDASWEQVRSGESFCLRKPDILKMNYGYNLEFRTMFKPNNEWWMWINSDSVLIGSWKWLSNKGWS